MAGVFVSTDDSEEGVSEHSQGDPAGPRGEAADLVFVQSGQALLDPATRTSVASGTGAGDQQR
jgi:hypothetical protein